MFLDSHCHLASSRYDPSELPELLTRAWQAGVARCITLATCMDDIEANLAVASNPQVHACLGIHPCDVHRAPDDATEKIRALLKDERICGIGESGLDYYHPAPDGWDEAAFRQRQRSFLERHFELAASSGLNIVLHTRDRTGHGSLDDALAIYQDFQHAVRALFHCFVHGPDQVDQVLALGGIVSFGGVATFKNSHTIRESIRHCPDGSFLIETDAPYLAPEPRRGSRNEPAYLRFTADRIALERGASIEALADSTNRCADEFFRFRPVGK